MVTPCVIHNLSRSAADGLNICPSNTPSCPFPEVKHVYSHIKIKTMLQMKPDSGLSLMSLSVFQLQCAADPVGLLSVPADQ